MQAPLDMRAPDNTLSSLRGNYDKQESYRWGLESLSWLISRTNYIKQTSRSYSREFVTCTWCRWLGAQLLTTSNFAGSYSTRGGEAHRTDNRPVRVHSRHIFVFHKYKIRLDNLTQHKLQKNREKPCIFCRDIQKCKWPYQDSCGNQENVVQE